MPNSNPLVNRLQKIRKSSRKTLRRFNRRLEDLFSRPEPPQAYIEIQPARVQFARTGEKAAAKDGTLLNGDWDLERQPLDELPAALAFQQRFVHLLPWEQTGYAWEALERTAEGQRLLRDYGSREAWQGHLNEIDSLYQEMQAAGSRAAGEADVLIGRNGEIIAGGDIAGGGAERILLARLLQIPEMRTRVTARHPGWMKFRKEIWSYARDVGGKIYHPITHPDLCDIPSSHTDLRWQFIEPNIPLQSGLLLDIGANFGFFDHKLEDKGFHCTAVELRPRNIYFLERLKTAEGRQFEIFKGSIFDFHSDAEFDIVLALNIFHHFLRVQDRYEQLAEFLQRTHMRYMFLETHNPNEPHMLDTYRNYGPDEYVKFVLANSCLEQSKFLHETEGGRQLYLLSADRPEPAVAHP